MKWNTATIFAVFCTAAVTIAVVSMAALSLPQFIYERSSNEFMPAVVPSTIKLTSSAFENNGRLPAIYTCDGRGTSPPLTISGVPTGTQSLTLVLHDPDAPSTLGFDHWVAFNIDPATTAISEGQVPVGTSGKNDNGGLGYFGPCPPLGTHHYIFMVYAVDGMLPLSEGASKADVFKAMQGHVLDQARLVGMYGKLQPKQ
ncbi:MAG: YbhB/YbcL family Raf kinase inhibitor-like protein [Minisyncoccia bacterium]